MMRALVVGFVLLVLAAPIAARGDLSDRDLLEQRLRACLVSGSAGAPRDSLLSAVVAVRSLCQTQINRLRDFRLHEVDRGFGSPEAGRQDALEQARKAAIFSLNDEVARAISNFTGLTE
jgi:hypothetical protein